MQQELTCIINNSVLQQRRIIISHNLNYCNTYYVIISNYDTISYIVSNHAFFLKL